MSKKVDAPVVWRDGVHLAHTRIWCDAQRPQALCFLSHAAGGPVRHHGQLVATQGTLDLLPNAERSVDALLAATYDRPFYLGDIRLELFPSGFMPGSASLLAEVDGRRIVYAGSIHPHAGRLAGSADSRPADVIVVDATFGTPEFDFPAPELVLARLRPWVKGVAASGALPVILTDPLTTGPDLARWLAPLCALRAHRSIARRTSLLARAGLPVPAVKELRAAPPVGAALLWPATPQATRDVKARLPKNVVPVFALASGWAASPELATPFAPDERFPLADRAGFGALRDAIAASGAAHVVLLGGGSPLAAELERQGATVTHLGPPVQLPLFG